MESLASRYAGALFVLAQEENKLLEYQDEIRSVFTVTKDNPEFTAVLSHYKVSNEAKKALIDQAFQSASKTVLHFLKLLIDKNRFHQIKSICQEFISMVNRARGIQEGFVYSAQPLEQNDFNAIVKTVSESLKSQVELKNLIDSSLIGGFKVVVGDTIFDNSIRNKIDSLKYELLEGKR